MKRFLYILMVLPVMLFSSCIEDITEGSGAFRGSLHVDLEVEGLTAKAATRATIPALNGEDQVGSLYLLFFEPDANLNGRFVDYVKVDNISGMAADISLAETGLTANSPYHILAVANIFDDSYISQNNHTVLVNSWLEGWRGKRERQVLLEANALVAGGNDDSNAILSNQLLMSASISKPEGQSKISLLLTRNVVRIDVKNEKKNDYDLVSASIWNAYPTTPIWDGAAVDYSKEIVRLERFYGIDNRANAAEDVEGDGEDGADETLKDITGCLYVFPNQVTKPEQNDKLTTCIIIGLRNRTTGTTSYYRANINTDDEPQMLIRNNVYSLTIKDVLSEGYNTEETAFNGRSNNLVCKVNQWTMDDNGLIKQDDNSILMIPTKTITIGRAGGKLDYTVFISSKLPNPGPLSILSQIYEPDDRGIVASIDGNIIHVEATPLAQDQTERRGIMMLSYAGLQTAINVIQSADAETYLTVTLPDGGIPTFPAVANIASGLITVTASGPWTAKVYMNGFSFTEGKLVTEIHSTDVAYVKDNKFRIYTNTTNPEENIRQAFVEVTLDSAPARNAVVRVAQKAAGVIKISPDQAVVNFNIDGDLIVPLPPVTNVKTFNIRPNMVPSADDPNTEYVPEWKVELIQSGMYDDRAMFKVTAQHYDPANLDNNTLTLDAAGTNFTGHTATVTVRVSQKDDPGTFAEIRLNQRSFQWDVPNTPQNIPGKGGFTPLLMLNLPAEVAGKVHYTAAIESFDPMNIYGAGADQQFAYLIDGDDNSATPYSSLQPNDVAVGFKVGFPSLPIALANATPKVTIAVTLVETGETKTFTVSQNAFPKRDVNLFDTGDYGWGNFGSGDNSNWLGNNGSWAAPYQWYLMYEFSPAYTQGVTNFGPTGTIPANVRIANAHDAGGFSSAWPVVQGTATWVNFNRPSYQDYSINNINPAMLQWMASGADGLMMINAEEDDDGRARADFSTAGRMPYELGLKGGRLESGTQQMYINPAQNNPIMNYLLNGPFGKVSNVATLQFATGGNTSAMTQASVEALGHGATWILGRTSTGGTLTGQLVSTLMIDPSRNLIIKTDSEQFDGAMSGDMAIFRRNFVAFCVMTAQYGSLFTNQFWDAPYDVKTMPQPQP